MSIVYRKEYEVVIQELKNICREYGEDSLELLFTLNSSDLGISGGMIREIFKYLSGIGFVEIRDSNCYRLTYKGYASLTVSMQEAEIVVEDHLKRT